MSPRTPRRGAAKPSRRDSPKETRPAKPPKSSRYRDRSPETPSAEGTTVPAPEIRAVGASALLLDLPDLDAVLAWHAELTSRPVNGQIEALAAARTVLVRLTDSQHHAAALTEISARRPRAAAATDARRIDVDVVYDGEDLDEVAERTGLSRDAVIAAHTDTDWTAAFSGFAPGFSYLSGGDPRLAVPRRDNPRTAVPAGSVALAGEFTAVYPQRSPGGWQLIGHSAAELWDLDRTPPALITPGDTVRFRAVRATARAASDKPAKSAKHAHRRAASVPDRTGEARLEVLTPGPRLLLQDSGRPGLGDQGVSASGAADLPSAHQADRLVGNPPDEAVLELTWGPVSLRAHGTMVVALTGARGPAHIEEADTSHGDASHSGGADENSDVRAMRDAPRQQAFPLADGAILHVGAPESGLRSYLAVRGGFAVPEVLGSRATDTLSGIGPAPLAAGDRLPVRSAEQTETVGAPEPPATDVDSARDADGAVVLPVLPGPRADRFGTGGVGPLTERPWQVSGDADRVGLRLETDGEPLQREDTSELPSEGMVLGAIQVPPTGLPVVFLADHPTTGGYPVIAVLDPAAVPIAAQLRAGDAVRFVPLSGSER